MNSSILFGIFFALFVSYWTYISIKENKKRKIAEKKYAEIMREMKRTKYRLEGIRNRNTY